MKPLPEVMYRVAPPHPPSNPTPLPYLPSPSALIISHLRPLSLSPSPSLYPHKQKARGKLATCVVTGWEGRCQLGHCPARTTATTERRERTNQRTNQRTNEPTGPTASSIAYSCLTFYAPKLSRRGGSRGERGAGGGGSGGRGWRWRWGVGSVEETESIKLKRGRGGLGGGEGLR